MTMQKVKKARYKTKKVQRVFTKRRKYVVTINDFAKAATNGSLMYNGDCRRDAVELFVLFCAFEPSVLKGIAGNTYNRGDEGVK